MRRPITRLSVALVGGFNAILDMPGILLVKDQRAVFAVQHQPVTRLFPRPEAMLPVDRTSGEIISDSQGVGSFLIVVVEELAAAGSDANGSFQVEEPADPVERVNAVVAQLAAAEIPHPVPAVMETIGVEGPFWGGSDPKIIVHTLWDRCILFMAD